MNARIAQDTPSARFTYGATIRVPAGMIALMSAENPTSRSSGNVYRFRMTRPVPTYLVALAVGDFHFQGDWTIRWRVCGTDSDRSAASALTDTPAMVAAAERLWGHTFGDGTTF